MQKRMGKVSELPSPQEAIKIILEAFEYQPDSEEVSLLDAKGRVLAKDILANEYFPSFDRSAMDGYSVIASDLKGASKETPVTLTLAGEVLMGDRADQKLAKGTCIYTPTGAAVPEGCESVAMVEDTKNNGDGTISFYSEIDTNKNVIRKGDGVYPGKKILSEGRVLNISDIGSLGTLGYTKVPVVKKPVIGILSTGDELVGIEDTPEEGQIRDINSVTMALAAEEAGGEVCRLGIVKDQEEVLFAAVEKALDECDMVLISGGSSMGEKDATEQVVERLGRLILHGVRMKPGKPVIVGEAKGKPIFGVPGNPISAYFVTRVFIRKLIRKMLGADGGELFIDAELTADVRENKKRSQFDFAKLTVKEGASFAEPVKTQSGLMASMAECDAFFVTMVGSGDRKAGEHVIVHPL